MLLLIPITLSFWSLSSDTICLRVWSCAVRKSKFGPNMCFHTLQADVKPLIYSAYFLVKRFVFRNTVVQESRSCVVSVSSDQQFISSSSLFSDINSMSSCGSRSHPWHLEAPPGQRINVSLLDFTGLVSASVGRDTTCRQYGFVLEKSSRKNISICSTTSMDDERPQRERAVYTSDTNKVDIVLSGAVANSDNSYNFLVRTSGNDMI